MALSIEPGFTVKKRPRALFHGAEAELHPINQDVQTQPHHVHKVPVPSRTFKTKMTVFGEVTFLQTQSDEQEHQHADEHVETVKTGQHVESRAVNAR